MFRWHSETNYKGIGYYTGYHLECLQKEMLIKNKYIIYIIKHIIYIHIIYIFFDKNNSHSPLVWDDFKYHERFISHLSRNFKHGSNFSEVFQLANIMYC